MGVYYDPLVDPTLAGTVYQELWPDLKPGVTHLVTLTDDPLQLNDFRIGGLVTSAAGKCIDSRSTPAVSSTSISGTSPVAWAANLTWLYLLTSLRQSSSTNVAW